VFQVNSSFSFAQVLGNIADLKHCPRILSLDGGGVRGLSALLILRAMMEEIGRRNQSSEPPKPCQYFDLIGGSGTGGLIAIMLGRLEMVTRKISARFDSRLWANALTNTWTL
jgi:patatin-like phospholipase/acyl hydrolase